MVLDFLQFSKACRPDKALDMGKPEDRQYYIDFSSVRGGEIIKEIARTITRNPNERTCQLFTGHIGCGKSTELLRLKTELENQGFHVIYFESSQDLDLVDVGISDILLAIAGRISENLESIGIRLRPRFFTNLFADLVRLLKTPIDLGGELSVGIAKITAKTKENPKDRSQLREYLESKTSNLLTSINEEILTKANQQLRQQGKKGLVVIVDNLDRVGNRLMSSGRTLPEYLFIDQGSQLGGLNCHVVYTIPLSLKFSSDIETLTQRLGGGRPPRILPMVPLQTKDGSVCEAGMEQLRQMVLIRAFPSLREQERLQHILEVFDSPDTLEQLCRVSGGHVRKVVALLSSCCIQIDDAPIFDRCLERVIREERDKLMGAILEHQWELLRQVKQTKKIVGSEPEYQQLLRSMFVYEYRDEYAGPWFDINPLLAEAEELK